MVSPLYLASLHLDVWWGGGGIQIAPTSYSDTRCCSYVLATYVERLLLSDVKQLTG